MPDPRHVGHDRRHQRPVHLPARRATSGTAADFLVYASSPEPLGAGRLAPATSQPANQTVALSDDFLQPGRLPRHAAVFNVSVQEHGVPAPAEPVGRSSTAVVDPQLAELMARAVLVDLAARDRRQARRGSRRTCSPRRSSPRRPAPSGSRRAAVVGQVVVRRSSSGGSPLARPSSGGRRSGLGDRVHEHRPDQLDLPGPRAVPVSRGRDGCGIAASPGGVQSSRRTESGVSRFSTGTPCSLGQLRPSPRGPAPSRSAATGSCSAQARGSGGPSVRGARVGQVVLGHRRARVRAATHAVGVALGAAAVEAPGAQQRARASVGIAWAAATIAASGMIRPGRDVALARRSRRGSPTARGPRPAPGGRGPGAGPTYGATARRGRRAEGCAARSNSWRAHSSLPASTQLGGQHVAQLDEHLDVEGGVLQPRLRQRPGRPVGGGVLLGHPVAEQGLDERGQPDARVAEQPPGQLGVEQRGRGAGRPRPGRARSWVAACRIHSVPASASCSGRQRVERDRVDQAGAGALAAQLDQVGAGGVAVARGPLGVDRDRAGAGRERGAGLGQRRPGSR